MAINISIVLPTRNRGQLLRAPLDSIYRQLLEGDEVVVSINGEREETEALLESYRALIHPATLRIVRPNTELSIYRHWNFAIQQTKNPWIVFLHDDECYNQKLLSTVRGEIERNSALSLILGGTVNLEVNPSPRIWKKNEFTERRTVLGTEWLEEQTGTAGVNYSSTCYIFKKRESYQFLADETRVSDILLMFWQALEGEVLELPMVFGTHLLHATNQSWTDYLTLGQTPYWEGLTSVAFTADSDLLRQMALQERNKAVGLYLRNATHAALPRGDRDGYRECLNQAQRAGAAGAVVKIYSMIAFNKQVFNVLAKLAKSMRERGGRSRFWKDSYASCTLSEDELKTNLAIGHEEWEKFLELARGVAR